jgi:hypothetical protein
MSEASSWYMDEKPEEELLYRIASTGFKQNIGNKGACLDHKMRGQRCPLKCPK